MRRRSNGAGVVGAACLIWIGVLAACFAGWVNHFVYCFQNHQYLLLLVGAVAAPLGVIHGWGLWFGWWH